ncbi:unnamed protein product (macronuclear) [Paramecium tetraurelia]|uniref:EGF-like domain-containing protein n=1 Tax=Paramecium tetraurelia TaxID=5888 RepID=A0BEH1_PARTE|nr:uncharacterized protein GSPATT00027971001 [Paramecium tetraurelia]CAK56938.1 unnamed protein product [Paramecium tetraurelia]|eukprot:XP_001424336.1 hypothetical protein (macronuclear) [Paramecium tetraurelia strain d4-2]
MNLYLLLFLFHFDCYLIILNSTRQVINEFCVNHESKKDLIIVVEDVLEEEMDIQWELLYINSDPAMTVNGCLTQQYQKRAYTDWAVRLGNQILLAERQEFNFTLQEPRRFYNLIDLPIQNDSNKLVMNGATFQINQTRLQINSDYFIRVIATKNKIQIFSQLLQIRIMLLKGDLIPKQIISLQKLVNPEQTQIILSTAATYDWKIFIKDPTRFGPILSTISEQKTSFINISLTPTWTDKLYIITIIVIDSDAIQYYQTDWFHQIGQQWAYQSTIDCNITVLSDNNLTNWTQRYSCLEWSTGELKVLLPQYDYVHFLQNSECNNNGQVQSSYQPLQYCLCKDNYTGDQCQTYIDEAYYNQTQSYFQILIDNFQTQTLDNSTFQRILYLLVKETQGYDQMLFDLVNSKSFYFSQQLLLIYDTLAIKSIINNKTNITIDIFKSVSNIKNLFEMTGIISYTNFIFYISTINQLKKIENNTFQLEYTSNTFVDYSSKCIFLSSSFIFAQMTLYSPQLSYFIGQNIYSQYMNCQVFSINTNLILNINTNITIVTNFLLSQIQRPTQLRCKSNSTINLCRIHKLYDYYAEASFDAYFGPYVIERSPIQKTFDYQTIVESIKNPSFEILLHFMIIQVLFNF